MEDQKIYIRFHKGHDSFLNSNGKDFLKHLKLYDRRYIFIFSWEPVKNL